MTGLGLAPPCPCGTGTSYDACCGRFHRRAERPSTPEELMRSRYSAFAMDDLDYVFVTWHPRTRPDTIEPDPTLEWVGLEIVSASGDEVEFVASYLRSGAPGERRERSRFEQRGKRWVYVDGIDP
ncbi:YchJ family protein [Nocardioides salsibiostraticola]